MPLSFGDDFVEKFSIELPEVEAKIEEWLPKKPDLAVEVGNLSKKIEELTKTVDELKRELAVSRMPNTIPIFPITYPWSSNTLDLNWKVTTNWNYILEKDTDGYFFPEVVS